MKNILLLLLVLCFAFSCKQQTKEIDKPKTPFIWEAANVYFLLTDRFNNGDTTNDINFDRTEEPGLLRGFEGGDLKGVTQKIEEGYFSDLGINAIWMTPVVEQIHDGTDEGTGLSYGFHGYWAKDWTNLDPNFGTKQDLKNLVDAAHKKGIRVLLDAVVNHTGPVTDEDPVWPGNWVRTEPQCAYDTYENTVTCTLVKNLPDIKTESDEEVDLPPQLVAKWKAEGRYDQEVLELEEFFNTTGYPKAPRFYIMKWLSDYITDYGIDGYRVDTVKHTEEYVWQEFRTICNASFDEFKKNNPDKVLDDNQFYLVGEVYNYGISAGKAFDFGDKKVNYFDGAFNSLINFELKWNVAQQTKEEVFKSYSDTLNTNMKGYSVLNYLSSHDDGKPFDPTRQKPFETANMLLLTPGASQIYYGDESARNLVIEGTVGDATLRSNMNWEAIKNDSKTQKILKHWQKLGQFRNAHPAVGAGKHQMITQSPYVFYRSYSHGNFKDLVVVAMDLQEGKKTLKVGEVFEDGTNLRDAYSNQKVTVKDGFVELNSQYDIVLLEQL
nr:alpha-amylase family glycosyl hydrolase [uncultured Psychroserpens sp.]